MSPFCLQKERINLRHVHIHLCGHWGFSTSRWGTLDPRETASACPGAKVEVVLCQKNWNAVPMKWQTPSTAMICNIQCSASDHWENMTQLNSYLNTFFLGLAWNNAEKKEACPVAELHPFTILGCHEFVGELPRLLICSLEVAPYKDLVQNLSSSNSRHVELGVTVRSACVPGVVTPSNMPNVYWLRWKHSTYRVGLCWIQFFPVVLLVVSSGLPQFLQQSLMGMAGRSGNGWRTRPRQHQRYTA